MSEVLCPKIVTQSNLIWAITSASSINKCFLEFIIYFSNTKYLFTNQKNNFLFIKIKFAIFPFTNFTGNDFLLASHQINS